MLSKFSVKKPFSVLVMVVMILVFGGVSFTKMTPDLFPNIDLPYVMVMTAYPGAAPEEVESKVTSPMEQQMASLENLKKIDSVSGESYSMILLEFNSDADLSVVSVDIRDKIDLVSGKFDEQVQKPVVFKMNPNMMPITVAAVNQEGMTTDGVSTLVEEELIRQLEGVDGVAGVSTAGMVENTVHITLNQERIDEINEQIQAVVNGKLSGAEASLAGGIESAKAGQQQLNGGKAAITEGQQALAAQKELVGNALSQLRILVIQREGLLKLGLTEEAKKVQATIDGIRSGMKAGEAELAKVGVDLSTIDKDLASINLAISNFNISMAVASDTLGNQMAELTGTGAYLQSLTLQLEASMAEMKESAKSAGAKVNMDGMLTVENLSSLLKAQNMDLPAGYIAQGEQELLVSVGDKFKGIEELIEMVLVNPGIEGIAPIKLSDVATVSYMSNGEDTYAKINGEDGVLLTFSKQSDVSTAQ
ncbi:MAG: efflux RND transporter permease subunit, partial [Anaerovoracaceae bacterium]